MFCPHCKNKLYSEVLKNCPFCGKIIEAEHDDGKTSKKVAVSHFVPGFKKLPEKEKRTTGTRGIETNFSTELCLDGTDTDIETQRPTLKKFNLAESVPMKKDEHAETPRKEVKNTMANISSPELVASGFDPVETPTGGATDESLSSPTALEGKYLGEGRTAPVPIIEIIGKPVGSDERMELVSPFSSDLIEDVIPENAPPGQEKYEKEPPEVPEPPKKEKKGLFKKRTKNNSLDTQENIDPAAEKKLVGFFGRKQKEKILDINEEGEDEQSVEGPDDGYEENSFDTNVDGYYDDLIPELARQINKIPQENLIKAVLLVAFATVAVIIVFLTT